MCLGLQQNQLKLAIASKSITESESVALCECLRCFQ